MIAIVVCRSWKSSALEEASAHRVPRSGSRFELSSLANE